MLVESKLDVLADVPDEKVRKLGDFISNDIIPKIPDPAKIPEILGDRTDIDVIKLVNLFCEFILSKENPDQILQIIESSKLSKDKMKTLRDIIQNFHKVTESNKAVITSSFLKTWIDHYVSNFATINEPKKNINEEAFKKFLKIHLNDPKYAGKYVAFVHGKFQKYGTDDIELIKEMYDRFGNVSMHVDKITSSKQVIIMETPEFL